MAAMGLSAELADYAGYALGIGVALALSTAAAAAAPGVSHFQCRDAYPGAVLCHALDRRRTCGNYRSTTWRWQWRSRGAVGADCRIRDGSGGVAVPRAQHAQSWNASP